MVRASDTDVLVILSSIIMDYGMGNARRYINVTSIAYNLEQQKSGFSRALPGYHAFTGCDFTSAIYR